MAEKEPKNNNGVEEGGEEEQQSAREIPGDFYERLGVSRDASADEINIAWKKKISQYKPSVNKDRQEAKRWSEALDEARRALGDDPEEREKYDQKHPASEKEDDNGKERQEPFSEIPADFYERLGVSRDASAEEIDRAWKEQLKRYHPDVNDGREDATEWTKALNEAKQTLGEDPKKRERYNEEHPGPEEEKKAEEKKKEERAKKKTKETAEKRAEVVTAYDAAKMAGDRTRYDMSAVRTDEYGNFVFVDGLKVYVEIANDISYAENDTEKKKKIIGMPYAKALNPFWKKQADLMTPGERAYAQMPQKVTAEVTNAREKLKHFTRSLLGLNENPREERETLKEYDELVRGGKAEFMGELAAIKKAPGNHPKPNLPDERLYRVMKKRYAKKGSFDDYEFKLIGVYDEKGKFTGKTRLYRLKKAA